MISLEMYYRAVVDCWRLFRKYRSPQESFDYWKELHDDMHQVYEKNQHIFFVKCILFAMLDEIERVFAIQGGNKE